MKKKLLIISSGLTLIAGISTSANAALATDSVVLNFNSGVATTSVSSTVFVKSGSYFGMDRNGDSEISASERIALVQNDGLFIGQSQLATGSHSGAPDGSESPGIDKPWSFVGNTGMSLTRSPVNILSDDGVGNVTLDFSGWGVTWNGVGFIPLGSGARQSGFTDGVARVSCSVDCSDGDSYTLDYFASAPSLCGGCGKDGTGYALHLEGTISSVPVPAAIWLFGSGLLGLVGVARRRRAL